MSHGAEEYVAEATQKLGLNQGLVGVDVQQSERDIGNLATRRRSRVARDPEQVNGARCVEELLACIRCGISP